jgi:hypothetical protein
VSGLATDPKRQANDALRGYVYQILRSVMVWIELGDRDELILEGAEDLDLITNTDALVEQVKDTAGSGTITLRTPAVRDALGHFWGHRQRNPGYQIRFRYLTTSEIGLEQGAPFGSGQTGLGLWTSIQADPATATALADTAQLAAFIAKDAAFSPEIRAFCASASPQAILDQLILPMAWIAGQGDGDSFVRRIKDKLIIHGKTEGVSADEADKAFDPLYMAALDAAKSKDAPPLSRAEFLRIFDAATSMQMRTHDVVALIQKALATPTSASAINVATPEIAIEARPHLPLRYFRRENLEGRLGSLTTAGPVVLQGGTGTGKTLLAASALRDNDDTAWLSLRDLPPAEVRARLVAARAALMAIGRPLKLVLDDLDGTADPRLIESPLSSLAATAADLGGVLIITSAHPLSSRLAQLIGLAPEATLAMPSFEDSEIQSFVEREGCPSEDAPLWSTIIAATTSGHPQLVHARIAALASAGFPRPSPADFLGTPPDVDAVRSEARRLIAALPAYPRELLYRLSLVTTRMSRSRIMAVARADPPIAEPGAAIDLIAGPWLEKTDGDAYRVSPLVRESATAARGLPWVRSMHGKISWAYMIERSITPLDIGAILTHCLLSGSAGPLAYLMQGLFTASDDIWEHIAEATSMFTSFGLEDGTDLPFQKPTDRFIFRHFQYRIAIYSSPETGRRIAARFVQEAAQAATDDATGFFRFLFVSQLLTQTRIAYPIATLVDYTRQFQALAATMEEDLPERLAKARMEHGRENVSPDYDSFISYPLMTRVQDIDQIRELLDALEPLPDTDIAACLRAFAGQRGQSSLIVDRVWLAELESRGGRWSHFVVQLRRLLDLALRLNIRPLALAIAPSLVRIIDENLNDSVAAVVEAETRIGSLGDDAVLMCALAKVKKRAGAVKEALALWTTYLPRRTDEEGNLATAYDYRTAAQAAGGVGDWQETESFLLAGHALVDPTTHATYALGLQMDAAFAAFMAGKHEDALARFGQVLADLEPLQAQADTEPLLSLQRRIAGVLSGITAIREGKVPPETAADLAGICSVLDRLDPPPAHPPPLDFMIRDTLEVELHYAKSFARAEAYAERLRQTPYVTLLSIMAFDLFELATRTGDYSHIVADGVRQLRATSIANIARQSGNYSALMTVGDADPDWPTDFDLFILTHVLAATLRIVANGQGSAIPIAAWRTALPDRPHARLLRNLVDQIDGLFVAASLDAWHLVVEPGDTYWASHLVAAIAATTETPRTPEELLRCHGLWAHYCAGQPLHDLVGPPVADLVAGQWSNMCLFPGSLTDPGRGIPALRRALALQGPPWQQIKAILSAAAIATGLRSDNPVRASIAAIVVEP